MRIRSLEVTGFKSFADRTALAFGTGISAIVGPNGCGKSNVVDALRWVMGEQNPRTLRGRTMDDVIFAGTEKKVAVGMAEVVLTIDNSNGLAPAPYKEFGEIQLARRLYRSGESEYLINKVPVRLKDVLDFFLDSGVGARGYTIVQQGQIADLVSSKPQDRRFIFEEAAGIGKYRQRRKETESKLRSTEQNLTRINDIIGELRRQISSLDRQARKANRYKLLTAEVRELELVVASEAFQREAAELAEAERQLEADRVAVAGLDAQVAGAESRLEAERRSHLEAERELQSQSEALFGERSEIQRLESQIEYESRECESLERLAAEREKEVEGLREQRAAHTAELNTSNADLANTAERLAAFERELARHDAELRSHAEKLAGAQGRREAEQATLVELSAEAATLESRREANDDRRRELELRLRANEDALEASSEAAMSLHRDETGLEGRLRESLADREGQGRTLGDQLRSHEQAQTRAHDLRAQLDRGREALQHAAAQLESLREIEKRESRRSAAVLEQIPADRRGAVRGLLSDAIRARDGAEAAVEAVLEGRLEAIVVDDADRALDLLRHLRKESVGRATFLPIGSADGSTRGFVPLGRPLAEFVDADPSVAAAVGRLLDGVYLVDDLRAAVERFGGSDLPATFVTRDGDLLDRTGSLTGGLGAPPGALSRAGELRRLEMQTAQSQSTVEGLEQTVAAATARFETLGREIENSRNRLHTAELAVVNLEKDLERMRERGKEVLESLEEQRSGKEVLVGLLEQLNTDLESAGERLGAIAVERSRSESSRELLATEIATASRELERVEQRVVGARVELAELGARRDQLTQNRDRLQKNVDEGREQIERRSDEVRAGRDRAAELTRSAAEAEAALQEHLRAEERLRGRQEELREMYERGARGVEEIVTAVRNAAGERENRRAALSEHEIGVHDKRSLTEALKTRIRERYEVDIASHRPDVEGLEGTPEEREAKLESLNQSLRSLGDVHLGAIEEYEEVSERHRYLTEQQADLDLSIERLRAAIARINRTSRARFREAFDAINAEFQRIFPEIFGGGRAHLSLTEAEDVLEAGIEITSQPPGKKLQNVNLLSGGEKSMTAIALLMAVFSVKPSPFFILDEVDAALDDANVGRFNAILAEMAKSSQFLMITHNKGAIESADTLYGVTMQEPGLSRLVTVDLVDPDEVASA